MTVSHEGLQPGRKPPKINFPIIQATLAPSVLTPPERARACAMDPLSIATSVIALATLCGQVVMLCNKLTGRKASIHRSLINLSMEVSTYQASLFHIQLLLIDQNGLFAKLLGGKNEWTESFDAALSACSITISVLISKLEETIASCADSALAFTLKEQDLQDLIGELRGQQQGLQVLLATLHLYVLRLLPIERHC
jgi:hypothetical protein